MAEKIYLSSPHMSDEGYEQAYIKEAFETNWISPLGNNVKMFEKEMNAYTGTNHAVALNAGTAAIHMALKAARVQKDDTIFCQSLTFAASANPILYEQATPVFIDSDKETWNMDPNALEEAFKKYPNAKAVIVVHLYGLSAKIEQIKAICDKYQATLIEDAAESLGTTYKDRQTGSFGDYGIYSFNGNKIITTSGGGMLVSNQKERIDKVRYWSAQAKDKAIHYQHSEIGYNYRLSNISAGIGRGQLKVLNQRIKRKKEIFDTYKKQLSNLEGLTFMPINPWNKPNYWLTCIQLKGKIRPLTIIEALNKENIESRPLWKPMHMQPVFKDYDFIGSNIAEDIFKNGLCLPSDTKMTDEQLNRIIRIIKGLW